MPVMQMTVVVVLEVVKIKIQMKKREFVCDENEVKKALPDTLWEFGNVTPRVDVIFDCIVSDPSFENRRLSTDDIQ